MEATEVTFERAYILETDSTSEADLQWVAGWLEGEGSFLTDSNLRPAITGGCTDRDVIEEVASILDTKLYGPYTRRGNRQMMYCINIYGKTAYNWMVRLAPYMRGNRRLSDIENLLILHRARYV